MRAVTLRRLMVYGVCLLGIGALYLVPSMAGTHERVSRPTHPGEPGSLRPTRTGSRPTVLPPAPQPTATSSTIRYVERPKTGERFPTTAAEPTSKAPSNRPSAFVPDGTDSNPPDRVTDLELRGATPDQLTLVWAPGTDDVGILRYRVWLDGYEVRTTSDTEVTLDWFNDDGTQHVVLVQAVDAAGNESEPGKPLLVTRPSPKPTDTPEPTTGPSPDPDGAVTPSTSGSTGPGGSN